MTQVRTHPLGEKQWLAFRHTPGSGPAIVFLPGYMSDMEGSKATALFDDCLATGRECLLLDYSGCGDSSGDFADGTLFDWAEDAGLLIGEYVENERIVLVGSSMGGWVMLLLGQSMPERLAGLVGIAAAPDFSDWGYTDEQKDALYLGDTIYEESDYGYDPMPTHAKFWKNAQANRVLGDTIPIFCPMRLLHGQEDKDVPPDISLRLAAALESEDVQVTIVKGGDHRLSRPTDIALLLKTVASL